MVWVWLAAVLVFVIIEAATAQLVTIWFAIGAVCAFIVSVFTDSLALQILVFAAVSGVALILTRPIVRKFTNSKKVPTNADMYIGMQGIVLEDINNLECTGLVKVKGSLWSARSSDDTEIDSGSSVRVEKIEGVKLIVTKIN